MAGCIKYVVYNVNRLCGYEMGEESEKQADGLNNALAADGVSR